MEKIFIQSALFSTTILVVYALVSPPTLLSAGAEPAFDETARARKGIIAKIDPVSQKIVVDFDGISIPIVTNASTTVNAPNGTQTELSFLRDGSGVYVFGNFDKESGSILAEKIVMRNRSSMTRKEPSRAESQEESSDRSAKTEELSLIAR